MTVSRSESFGRGACAAVKVPWEALRDTCRLFHRNPNLAKITIASGLQHAAVDIAPAFDIGPDPYNAWRKDGGGASYLALFNFGQGVWALLTAPAFLYFADRIDKRKSFAILALISCVPTWVYWFVDLDSMEATWVNNTASIFAATGTTMNIAFALAMDVTPFADRELASGGYYALKHFVAMLLAPLPCMILVVWNSFGLRDLLLAHQSLVLVYQLVLTSAFISVLVTVVPETRGSEDSAGEKVPETRGSEDSADEKVPETRGSEDADEEKCSSDDIGGSHCIPCAGLEMLSIMWNDYRLFRLCLAGFILSFCRTAALGNNGQYFYQVLSLECTQGKYIDVNILRNFAAHLAVPPGFLLTGYFAMKTGALRTLRNLIPVTALLLASGVVMVAVKKIWFTVVVEFILAMTGVYDGPLNRIVAGVARPGCVGAWLNMFGVAVEVGVMLGNAVIAGLNFTYFSLVGSDMPVFVYYPICGGLLFLALLPLWTNTPGPPDGKIGWGAAAGLPTEVLHSTLGAMRAAKKWRRKTLTARDKQIVLDEDLVDESSDDDPGLFANIARFASSLHIPGFTTPSSRQTPSGTSDDSEGREVRPRASSHNLSSFRMLFSHQRKSACLFCGASSSDGQNSDSGDVSSEDKEDLSEEPVGRARTT